MSTATSITVVIGEEAHARCGLGFNPGNDPATQSIKEACAIAMQSIQDNFPGNLIPVEAARYLDVALEHIEIAQMMAVKGLHAKTNAEKARAAGAEQGTRRPTARRKAKA